MKISETGKNMEITAEIKNYLYQKIEHIEKFIDPADESVICDVELGRTTEHHKNGDIFRAEINLHIAGKNMYAVAEKEDLFVSIDIVKDQIIRELKSNKEKKRSLLRRGGAKIKNIVRGVFIKRSS